MLAWVVFLVKKNCIQLCSLVAQMVKNLPAMQETRVQSLGREDPLDKGMATHSIILSWRIPWTEEPGGLQSMQLQRVGHDGVTNSSTSLLALNSITLRRPQWLLWLRKKENRAQKGKRKSQGWPRGHDTTKMVLVREKGQRKMLRTTLRGCS